jgi:hypothetical protein
MIIWEGPSEIDGGPIVVIAVGTVRSKANTKTGEMVQTYILRSDMGPFAAVQAGADRSICGDCRHRGDGTGKERSCYVTLIHGPRVIYDAFSRGIYRRVPPSVAGMMFTGQMIRLGTYGDPAAVPLEVWDRLTANAEGWTGYTHQWRAKGSAWSRLLMASVDTPEEMLEARALGWRTFRVGTDPIDKLEMTCPASEEAGRKVQCIDCKACMGTGGKARVSIQIAAHGAGKKWAKEREAA